MRRLLEFIRLFNEKHFFDAHEMLEDEWIETEGADKDFYKGLIQCAVAFVHLERGNFRGAKKLYKTSVGYLQRYPEQHMDLEVGKLLDDFREFFRSKVPDAEAVGAAMDLESQSTPQIRLSGATR